MGENENVGPNLPLEEVRIHVTAFSEKEFHELNMVFLDHMVISNEQFKKVYPKAWEFLNRLSYVVSHGTEQGWESNRG